MATKPPSTVQKFSAESLENIAYTSVNTVPTEEPNDRNRLGYHIWWWLQKREETLEQAVAESGSRLHVSHHEAVKIIWEALMKQGITL